MNIPIYRAKKIDSDDYVEGYLEPSFDGEMYDCWAIRTSTKRNPHFWGQDLYEIDPSTLEISDGKKWRKLSECNFRTNYEMDMHSYNGYCNGWNAALTRDGKPPYAIYEQIKNNRSKDVDNE